MFLYTGGYRENIGIENDVGGRKANLFGENGIGPLTNGNAALVAIGLTHFVEGHHHHCSSITLNQPGLLNKLLLAFLERNRVYDRFPLHTLQTGFNHRPFRRVDHHRKTGNIGLRSHQVEKLNHGRLRVEHAFVHVHIQNLRPAFYLIAGHAECFVVVARNNQAGELLTTGYIGTFADVYKIGLLPQKHRF